MLIWDSASSKPPVTPPAPPNVEMFSQYGGFRRPQWQPSKRFSDGLHLLRWLRRNRISPIGRDYRACGSFMASGITTAAIIASGVHTRAIGVGRAVADDHGDDDDDGAENNVSDSRHVNPSSLVFLPMVPQQPASYKDDGKCSRAVAGQEAQGD